jgi:saccharopine dehydrogenase-like NADP-dependent oxidoreductase
MTGRVLILGGRGRIGSCVAADLQQYTSAKITVTGRTASSEKPLSIPLESGIEFLALNLADRPQVQAAIGNADLVIHCAGPFRYRDDQVIRFCIEQGVNYLDVSDDRSFTRAALSLRKAAEAAGVTAIINSGVFPGISNSMVRQGIEQLEVAEKIHLSYVVAGSGGAGMTVMQTTFLGLQNPFEVWQEGRWQLVRPYTGREAIDFPKPFGRTGVYWFDMPETVTLVDSFPVQSVTVKFGSAPDFYSVLTAMMARLPAKVVQNPKSINFLSKVSYGMTAVTDRFSGIGVAMRAEVSGKKAGASACYSATFVHSNTAIAVGYGTGSLAELMLSGKVVKPGVWAVEQALPTDLFERAMQSRNVKLEQQWRDL